jgi:hypothetical protein
MPNQNNRATGGEIVLENLEIKEPINLIDNFLDFSSKDIASAILELEKITDENNRKHLQKLVYVNLVNRFDYLIDKLILWFCIYSSALRGEVLKSIEDENISKREAFEMFFMREKSYDSVIDIEKIKDITRLHLLSRRHSIKLLKILKILNFENIEKPRVNSDGKIFETRKKHKTIPNSILGYADWLYCRRNSIVHGDGVNYSTKDKEYITKQYKVKLAKNFKLQLPSIKTAQTFYNDFLRLISEKIADQSYLIDQENGQIS